jgi:hypothetical protein
MPLIFQRKGHSCTIVGYEVLKDQSINLLMFDPAKYVMQFSSNLHLKTESQTFRCPHPSGRHCPFLEDTSHTTATGSCKFKCH